MQKDQLLELRNKIVQSTQELALKGQGSAFDRLQVLMNIIRDGNPSLEVLTRAFELSESIEVDDDKMNAMLELLYEVDAQLGSEADQPESQPEAPQQEAPQEQQHSDEHHNQEQYHDQ